MQIVTSWMQQGIEQGAQREARSLILRQLTRRFGSLSESLRDRVAALSLEQLESLSEALLDFTQVEDLVQWLTTHSER